MGIIQSTFNQALGMGALAAKMSPHLQKRAEEVVIGKEQEQLVETTKKLAQEEPDIVKRLVAQHDLGVTDKAIDIAERELALGKGSPKRVSELKRQKEMEEKIIPGLKTGKMQFVPFDGDFSKFKQSQAMKKVGDKQESQLSQKNRFKKYPEDLQNTIAILKGRSIIDDNTDK